MSISQLATPLASIFLAIKDNSGEEFTAWELTKFIRETGINIDHSVSQNLLNALFVSAELQGKITREAKRVNGDGPVALHYRVNTDATTEPEEEDLPSFEEEETVDFECSSCDSPELASEYIMRQADSLHIFVANTMEGDVCPQLDMETLEQIRLKLKEIYALANTFINI
jgi:hypothetical protein